MLSLLINKFKNSFCQILLQTGNIMRLLVKIYEFKTKIALQAV